MRAKLTEASQVTQAVHDGRRVTPPPGWMTARRRARYDRDLTGRQRAKARRYPPIRLAKQVIR